MIATRLVPVVVVAGELRWRFIPGVWDLVCHLIFLLAVCLCVKRSAIGACWKLLCFPKLCGSCFNVSFNILCTNTSRLKLWACFPDSAARTVPVSFLSLRVLEKVIYSEKNQGCYLPPVNMLLHGSFFCFLMSLYKKKCYGSFRSHRELTVFICRWHAVTLKMSSFMSCEVPLSAAETLNWDERSAGADCQFAKRDTFKLIFFFFWRETAYVLLRHVGWDSGADGSWIHRVQDEDTRRCQKAGSFRAPMPGK